MRRVNAEPWEPEAETVTADLEGGRLEEEEQERYVNLEEPDEAAEDRYNAEAKSFPETMQHPATVSEGCGSDGECTGQSGEAI
ncbi:hypothetical protein NDU88_003633 [Pleurodeles waltl]|uniref:Uncharacterized protein n=1 Tax=Pleurodeles waltl TaxID=8319 RepID=A0AAV7W6T0_PLEWA|nr:hypothetical protein NDU88_003633 [Pleurodeles waltl]